MNLTLKQARRVEVELDKIFTNTLNKIRSVSRETYASKRDAVEHGTAEILRLQKTAISIAATRQRIRDAIADANEASGINKKMAVIALRMKELEILDQMLNSQSTKTEAYRSSTYVDVYTAGFSQERIEQLEVEIRKHHLEVTKLKDSCSGMNNNTSIILTDKDSDFLVGLGLA